MYSIEEQEQIIEKVGFDGLGLLLTIKHKSENDLGVEEKVIFTSCVESKEEVRGIIDGLIDNGLIKRNGSKLIII